MSSGRGKNAPDDDGELKGSLDITPLQKLARERGTDDAIKLIIFVALAFTMFFGRDVLSKLDVLGYNALIVCMALILPAYALMRVFNIISRIWNPGKRKKVQD